MTKAVDFPRLVAGVWEQSSDPDPRYNCIAFAAGRTDVFWWPDDYPDPDSDYWPAGVTREETVEAFVKLYESIAYELCSEGKLEDGFERVAIFADAGVPTHAARQLIDGRWISKLGAAEDITHSTLEAIVGPLYGQVACYLRRPIIRSG